MPMYEGWKGNWDRCNAMSCVFLIWADMFYVYRCLLTCLLGPGKLCLGLCTGGGVCVGGVVCGPVWVFMVVCC